MRPHITLDDARWSCSQCGFCCTFVTLGPVEPAVIEGLEARAVGEDWEPASSGWYETRGGEHYLKRVNGGCVFLRPDRMCAVHDLYGAEAKPGFCRAFPLHAVETPESVAVVVRSDCSGVHETMRTGEDVAGQVEALLALNSPRARFAPEVVEVLPGQMMSTADWLAVERTLLASLSGKGPMAAVVQIRALLAERLGVSLPAPNSARFALAGRAVMEGMRLVTARAVEQGSGSPEEVDFAKENLARLEVALSAETAPVYKDTTLEYLGVLLRSYLLGKQYKGAGGPVPGLGMFLVTVQVASASAGEPLTLDALAHHLSRFSRFSNNHAIQQVIRAAHPALVDVFLNATESE